MGIFSFSYGFKREEYIGNKRFLKQKLNFKTVRPKEEKNEFQNILRIYETTYPEILRSLYFQSVLNHMLYLLFYISNLFTVLVKPLSVRILASSSTHTGSSSGYPSTQILCLLAQPELGSHRLSTGGAPPCQNREPFPLFLLIFCRHCFTLMQKV